MAWALTPGPSRSGFSRLANFSKDIVHAMSGLAFAFALALGVARSRKTSCVVGALASRFQIRWIFSAALLILPSGFSGAFGLTRRASRLFLRPSVVTFSMLSS